MTAVTLSGIVRYVTDMAVLWFPDETEEGIWIPRSVCEQGDYIEVGDTDIMVAAWFAEREGLE